jgi:hypothetical protein
MAESGRIWFPEPGMPLAAELLLFKGADGADDHGRVGARVVERLT